MKNWKLGLGLLLALGTFAVANETWYMVPVPSKTMGTAVRELAITNNSLFVWTIEQIFESVSTLTPGTNISTLRSGTVNYSLTDYTNTSGQIVKPTTLKILPGWAYYVTNNTTNGPTNIYKFLIHGEN